MDIHIESGDGSPDGAGARCRIHHAGSEPIGKTLQSPLALREQVEQRLRQIPLLRQALDDDEAFELLVGAPRAHRRDARGRNWDIAGFRSGFVHWHQCQSDFRRIVDQLRDRHDLA